MTSPHSPIPADQKQTTEKREAWKRLGESFGWAMVVLVAMVAAAIGAAVLASLLPEARFGLVALLIMLAILQLFFLHPVFSAFNNLFKIYIGRRLWQIAWIRWVVRAGFAAVVLNVIYQSLRVFLPAFSGEP